MAPFPAPETGILLTHFIVAEDIARMRDFYANWSVWGIPAELAACVVDVVPVRK
jgi:hypothetical protein